MSDGKIHSSIGASSYYRWGSCPGSVRLSATVPASSSVYAEEGTEAHDRAERALRGTYELTDDEMDEAVKVYVDFVQTMIAKNPGAELLVEQKFDLSHLHPGMFGTSDAVIYLPQKRHLMVIDYKHGAGVPVDAKENEQLLYYAVGAVHVLGRPVNTVEVVVVQPRCFHRDGPVRAWATSADYLTGYSETLVERAKATLDPDAPLVSGDHCKFCPAAAVCPELHSKAIAVAAGEFGVVHEYTPDRLSQALKMLPVLETFVTRLKEFAYQEAERGRCPPGFKLVEKKKRRNWKDEAAAAKFIERCFNDKRVHQCFEAPAIKSPAQVEKVFGKEKDKLAELIESKSTGTTLVEESDPRPAVALGIAHDFNDETI